MALLFSSFPPLACFAVTRGPRSGGCTDPLFPFHSVEHAHGLPQPCRTLLEYWAPLATHRLVFPPCARQDQAHCFCRKSWIKQKCDRYGLPLRNYKKKPTFSTFCCFSLGICGSDFHCHEYLKTFLPFYKACSYQRYKMVTSTLYLFSKQGKKIAPPWRAGNTCTQADKWPDKQPGAKETCPWCLQHQGWRVWQESGERAEGPEPTPLQGSKWVLISRAGQRGMGLSRQICFSPASSCKCSLPWITDSGKEMWSNLFHHPPGGWNLSPKHIF